MSIIGPVRRPVVPPVVQPAGLVGLPWGQGGGVVLLPPTVSIAGTVTIGGTLTATLGGGPVTSLTLYRDGVSAGTVTSPYTYVAADVGPSLTVKAVGPGGTSAASNALQFALPTASMVGDYDGTHVTIVSGRVSALLDQSSAAHDLAQSTAANRPTQSVGGGANGHDAIDFAENAGLRTYLNSANIGGGAAMSIYYLGETPPNIGYICDGAVGDSRTIARVDGAGGLLMYAGSVGPAIASPATGTVIALCAIFNGASSKMDIGGSTATGNVGAITDAGFTYGARAGAAATTALARKATLLLVYATAHSDAVRADIGAYLRYYGGL